jgi:hypothetical protein
MRSKPKPKLKRRTRGLTKIRQSEIARATRGMLAAGLSVRGVEVDSATGKFSVLIGNPTPAATNTWDDLLSDAEDEKRSA